MNLSDLLRRGAEAEALAFGAAHGREERREERDARLHAALVADVARARQCVHAFEERLLRSACDGERDTERERI